MKLVDLFAGTCGGISVTAVGHPFDTLKVRLQTQPTGADRIYSGVIDCARKTVQWEGMGGLYKGVMSPLVGQMFFRAALFGTYGFAKDKIAAGKDGKLDRLDYFIAGGITGLAASFAEGPIDFYKSQLQVQVIRSKTIEGYKPAYTGLTDVAAKTWAVNGPRAPFQGLAATICRNVPANAVYLGSFEMMKVKAAGWRECTPAELPLSDLFLAGGLGGLLYWLAVYPIDVVKSAIQTDAVVVGDRVYGGMREAARKLYAEGGVSRFYKGFTPCLLRAIPANGAMLVTVDKVKTMLG